MEEISKIFFYCPRWMGYSVYAFFGAWVLAFAAADLLGWWRLFMWTTVAAVAWTIICHYVACILKFFKEINDE